MVNESKWYIKIIVLITALNMDIVYVVQIEFKYFNIK